MKILSSEQQREADAFTIQHEPISSIDLMERAAAKCLEHILKMKSCSEYHVFCGKGNNGGDGLAIARMLAELNKTVWVFIIEFSNKSSEDFETNYKRLEEQNKARIIHIESIEQLRASLTHYPELTIDALLGTGTNKPCQGLLSEVIAYLNQNNLFCVAVDLPSGLIPDEDNDSKNTIVNASVTLTFQQPKLAFFFAENQKYTGEIILIDIGLSEEFIASQNTMYEVIDKGMLKPIMLHRNRFSHKGNFGHALLLAGSKGKTGAALLAAKACLRSGAGLCTAHIPYSVVQVIQTGVPEAMCSSDDSVDYLSALPHLDGFSAIAMGPGIGKAHQTGNVLKLLIQNVQVPLVLDADALTILGENKTWLAFLKANTILTPHPKEFDRMAGKHTSSFSRLQSAMALAHKYRLIIVLKGAYTACAFPNGKVYFNSSGNPGLAKGGSGDCLTGIILGLLARGYSHEHAALLGVYLHGLAADIAVLEQHPESLLAGDVIEKLGAAFRFIES